MKSRSSGRNAMWSVQTEGLIRDLRLHQQALLARADEATARPVEAGSTDAVMAELSARGYRAQADAFDPLITLLETTLGAVLSNDVALSALGGRIRRGRERARWSTRFDACVDCGRTDRRHRAKGACVNCYQDRMIAARRVAGA